MIYDAAVNPKASLPFLLAHDELGAIIEGSRIETEGLPEGLSLSERITDAGYRCFYLEGVPYTAGKYAVKAHAVFADGTTTPEMSFWMEVLPAPELPYSGNYEGLIERTDLNDNNGGVLSFAITSKGGVSGYLLHKFVRYPFSSVNVVYDVASGYLVSLNGSNCTTRERIKVYHPQGLGII